MSHDDKLKLATAMAQTSTEANGNGPEIDERLEPLVAACREGFEPLGPFAALIEAAQMLERQRIRAIVLRLMGNDWTANQVLEEIDRG